MHGDAHGSICNNPLDEKKMDDGVDLYSSDEYGLGGSQDKCLSG